MRCKTLIFVTLSFITIHAYADFNLKTCMADAKSNLDMKLCSQQVYEIATQDLNATYNQIINECTKNQSRDFHIIIDRLKSSQKAWLYFRDANCSLQATSMLGGSGETLIQSECLRKMTESRAHELRDLEKELHNSRC